MPTLRKVVRVRSSTHSAAQEDVDVTIIDGDDRVWVGLTAGDRQGRSYFWSQKIDSGDDVLPAEEVVKLICERLDDWQEGRLQDYHAFTLWPSGWDFWGSAVLEPISHYFRSQFREDLARVKMDRPGTG